jgi:hypothetical protein
MAEIQHSQIKAKLLEIVAPLVDQAGIIGKTDADKEVHILSRSTAAAALKIVAEIEYDAACAAIVDGGKDNGIERFTTTPKVRRCFSFNPSGATRTQALLQAVRS